jgi:hypothetical protein
MIQDKYTAIEALEKIKLHMKYDISKTLNENIFEQKSDYQIRIQTTDEGGLKYEKSFHILIIDVNEVPTLAPLGDIRLYNLTTEQEIQNPRP